MKSSIRESIRGPAMVVLAHALASLTNLLPTLVIARQLGVDALGKYAVAFAIYFSILGFVRAYVQETYLIEAANKQGADLRRYTVQSGRACLVAGLFATITGLATWPIVGELSATVTPILVLMPGLLLQDAARYQGFATRRQHRAAISDGLWLLTFGAAVPLTSGSLVCTTVAWALASWLAAIAVLRRDIFSVLRLTGAIAWFAEHRTSGGFFALDFTLRQAVKQSAVWTLAILGSFSAAGEFRAAEVMAAPLTLATGALMVAVVPVAARSATSRMVRLAIAYIGTCLFLGAVWIIVELFLPPRAAQALVGDAWPAAKGAAIAISISVVIGSVSQSALMILRIKRQMRRGLIARLWALPVSFACVLVGAWKWDAVGAALGLTASAIGITTLLAVQAAMVIRGSARD